MCRLFALRANRPTQMGGSLLFAAHSLCCQSGCDLRGERHEDGWGIGYYNGDIRPRRIRSTRPAAQDPRFRQAARSIKALTLIAHVRQGSMGPVSLVNSHPFRHGRWTFAHNGTINGFRAAQPAVRGRIADRLRRHIRGQTDSEHAFFLILSRLGELSPADRVNPPLMAKVFAAVIRELRHLCGSASRGSQFNFVFTDGTFLAASRWGRTLSWLTRTGQARQTEDRALGCSAGYRAVLVASEPTSNEAWQPVPDRHVLCVDARLRPTLLPLS